MRWLVSALYAVTFLLVWFFLWYAAIDKPTGADQFYVARKSAGDAQAAECGFRNLLPNQEVTYTQEDLIRISRCLQRRGYMSPTSVALVENGGWYGYRYGRRSNGDAYGFVSERQLSPPAWISYLWIPGLVGLVLIWVGFVTHGFRRFREPPT